MGVAYMYSDRFNNPLCSCSPAFAEKKPSRGFLQLLRIPCTPDCCLIFARSLEVPSVRTTCQRAGAERRGGQNNSWQSALRHQIFRIRDVAVSTSSTQRDIE